MPRLIQKTPNRSVMLYIQLIKLKNPVHCGCMSDNLPLAGFTVTSSNLSAFFQLWILGFWPPDLDVLTSLGVRPVRAARSLTWKVPSPVSATASPALSSSVTELIKELTSASALALLISASTATFVISSFFFHVVPLVQMNLNNISWLTASARTWSNCCPNQKVNPRLLLQGAFFPVPSRPIRKGILPWLRSLLIAFSTLGFLLSIPATDFYIACSFDSLIFIPTLFLRYYLAPAKLRCG